MQNRVTVTIADQKYTLLAAESQEYMEQVAALVDGQLRETMRAGGRLSLVEAAVLTAMNLADSCLKEQESAENLRSQLNEVQKEADKLKLELADAKRLADGYRKEQESANSLRRQIKETLEESAKLKLELADAKREIVKLQNEKK